jgi:hypothetical protein
LFFTGGVGVLRVASHMSGAEEGQGHDISSSKQGSYTAVPAGKKIRTVIGNPRPSGLIYLNDDDKALDEVDDDEEYIEKNFSSFPRKVGSRNHILGGPHRPDTSKMSKKEEKAALYKFEKSRKKYTDKN